MYGLQSHEFDYSITIHFYILLFYSLEKVLSLKILAKKREDYSEKKQEADDAIYSLVDKAYYVDSISYKTDNTASSFDETD